MVTRNFGAGSVDWSQIPSGVFLPLSGTDVYTSRTGEPSIFEAAIIGGVVAEAEA